MSTVFSIEIKTLLNSLSSSASNHQPSIAAKLGRFPFVIALFSLLTTALLTTQPARASIDAWCLDCWHRTYGNGKFYISAKGFKVDDIRNKRFFMSTAPSWNIIVGNTESHKYCVQSTQTYRHQVAANIFAFQFNQLQPPIKTAVHETVAGIPTTLYQSNAVELGPKGARRYVRGCFWVAEKLDLPKETIQAYEDCDNMPRLPGLILRAKFSEKCTDTFTAKRAKLPDNFFQVPEGYTQAKNLTDVMFSTDTLEELLGP